MAGFDMYLRFIDLTYIHSQHQDRNARWSAACCGWSCCWWKNHKQTVPK